MSELRARRKRKIANALRRQMHRAGNQNPALRPRIEKVEISQDLFDRALEFSVGLLEKRKPELAAKIDKETSDDDNPDNPRPIWNAIKAFLSEYWDEILAFIMSLFFNPGGVDLDMAPADAAAPVAEEDNDGEDDDEDDDEENEDDPSLGKGEG